MPKAKTSPEETPVLYTWTELVAANQCGDCGGALKGAEGSYGVRMRNNGHQYPVCRACKVAAIPGENERRKRGG